MVSSRLLAPKWSMYLNTSLPSIHHESTSSFEYSLVLEPSSLLPTSSSQSLTSDSSSINNLQTLTTIQPTRYNPTTTTASSIIQWTSQSKQHEGSKTIIISSTSISIPTSQSSASTTIIIHLTTSTSITAHQVSSVISSNPAVTKSQQSTGSGSISLWSQSFQTVQNTRVTQLTGSTIYNISSPTVTSHAISTGTLIDSSSSIVSTIAEYIPSSHSSLATTSPATSIDPHPRPGGDPFSISPNIPSRQPTVPIVTATGAVVGSIAIGAILFMVSKTYRSRRRCNRTRLSVH